ncbi:TOX high mobility group box family member 4b isoform X2 [Clupea harengus]|uniref:TOX high mobility group box family member 4b isoform X2 n=1 Tax=Clupea harengus TaxID=7950 RepID=A0A8M1KR84_CLUHA|nr:TOX high mobility group box family member 4b isoform X2 [Clupea harengus]
MDLNFYADLSEDTGQPGDPEFLDSQHFNGFDAVSKFPGGGDNYLAISGEGHHPFLSSSESLSLSHLQTFHTPSLGDEEFEIPPISLDPDSALGVSDFGELSDGGSAGGVPGNAVVGGDDPSFASTFVNNPSQGLDHLSLGVIGQQGGGTLLGSTLGMDLGHSIGSQFSSSSPVTIDVMNDMNHGLLGHNQLTTIDQSELSAQLGLSLGGGTILPRSQSPDQPMSASASPTESLQDDDMDDFRRSVLVDSPVSLSVSPGVISLSPSLSDSPMASSGLPALVRRGGMGAGAGAGGKKARKKKDPNEPQKPVSAYALFFRDTQAAIKGQNPNATFGEVSRIVASMWDSLGEEQKQVYKRKTETAKKEYLKALAAYRANQISQPTIEVMEIAPSPPPAVSEPSPPPATLRSARIPHHAPENNTITNICTSNIILDLPQVTTRSRTGAHKPAPPPTAAAAPPPPTVAKIIISKQAVLGAGSSGATAVVMGARQPPPLQQMQQKPTPPPPRLQQAPPPLQAKPRATAAGASLSPASSVATAPPPPLQIKIVPASLQTDTPIIVAAGEGTVSASVSSPPPGPGSPTPAMAVEMAQPTTIVTAGSPSAAEEVGEAEEGMEVELSVSPGPDVAAPGTPSLCVRAGCTNLPVESKDWDREYCSNECVATHCRDVFMAWCSIRGQNSTTVT